MSNYGKIVTLQQELSRLGLAGRVQLNGYKPEEIEVYQTEFCVASDLPADVGKLFAFASGPILYSWSQAGGRGEHRFPLGIGWAVCIIGERSSDLKLSLCGTC